MLAADRANINIQNNNYDESDNSVKQGVVISSVGGGNESRDKL